MRILVTGGAGFIGSHVADALLAGGHETAVLDNLSTGNANNVPAGAQFYRGDIRNPSDITKVFRAFKPDAVSHQAAQVSVAHSVREPIEDAETNVVGTIGILEACAAHGVERFVLASTGGAIYGEVPQGEKALADWPPDPRSPYACSKRAAEIYSFAYEARQILKVQVLRYANVYGPRQDPHGEAGVVAIFSQRLLSGEPLQINARREQGDDGCVRDYVFVEDVVVANMFAVEGRVMSPILNVSTGKGTSTRSLAERMIHLVGAGGNGSILSKGPRPGDLQVSVLDSQPFLHLLDSETRSLDAGLDETIEWFRQETPR